MNKFPEILSKINGKVFSSFLICLLLFVLPFFWFGLLRVLPTHLLFCQLTAFAFLITGKFSNAWAVQRVIGWNFLHSYYYYLFTGLEKHRD